MKLGGASQDATPRPVQHLRELLVGIAAGSDVLAAVDLAGDLGRRAWRPSSIASSSADPSLTYRNAPSRDQHDRHRERERECEAGADRNPAHRPSTPSSRRSRYPAPRTVSIELRPNGRSTFSRR